MRKLKYGQIFVCCLIMVLAFVITGCNDDSITVPQGSVDILDNHMTIAETTLPHNIYKTIEEGDVGSKSNPLVVGEELAYFGNSKSSKNGIVGANITFSNPKNYHNLRDYDNPFTFKDVKNNPLPVGCFAGSLDVDIELTVFDNQSIKVLPLQTAKANYQEDSFLYPAYDFMTHARGDLLILKPGDSGKTNVLFIYDPKLSDKIYIDLSTTQGLWVKIPKEMIDDALNH